MRRRFRHPKKLINTIKIKIIIVIIIIIIIIIIINKFYLKNN